MFFWQSQNWGIFLQKTCENKLPMLRHSHTRQQLISATYAQRRRLILPTHALLLTNAENCSQTVHTGENTYNQI